MLTAKQKTIYCQLSQNHRESSGLDTYHKVQATTNKEVQVTKPKVGVEWRGMWDSNPRGLSTTDLAGLPHTRLGESRTLPDLTLGYSA